MAAQLCERNAMAPTLRRGSKPVTLCVIAQNATACGRSWSVEGCIPTRSVGTIKREVAGLAGADYAEISFGFIHLFHRDFHVLKILLFEHTQSFERLDPFSRVFNV